MKVDTVVAETSLLTSVDHDFISVSTTSQLLDSKEDSLLQLTCPRLVRHQSIHSLSGIDVESWIHRHTNTRTSYSNRTSHIDSQSVAFLTDSVYDCAEGFVITFKGSYGKILHSSHHVDWQIYDYLTDRYGCVQSYISHVKQIKDSIPSIHQTRPVLIVNTKWSDRNYYHWVQEALPRLHTAFKNFGSSVDYVWMSDVQPKRFHVESMSLIGDLNLRIDCSSRWMRCKKLLWPSYHAPGSAFGYDFGWNIDLTSKDLYDVDRIFVARTNGSPRSLNTSSGVFDLLNKYGYKSLHLENFSFKDQVALFQRATHIVGCHGSGLVNCMFGQDLTVCELMPAKAINPCFAILCTSLAPGKAISNTYSMQFVPYALGSTNQILDPCTNELECLLQ